MVSVPIFPIFHAHGRGIVAAGAGLGSSSSWRGGSGRGATSWHGHPRRGPSDLVMSPTGVPPVVLGPEQGRDGPVTHGQDAHATGQRHDSWSCRARCRACGLYRKHVFFASHGRGMVAAGGARGESVESAWKERSLWSAASAPKGRRRRFGSHSLACPVGVAAPLCSIQSGVGAPMNRGSAPALQRLSPSPLLLAGRGFPHLGQGRQFG